MAFRMQKHDRFDFSGFEEVMANALPLVIVTDPFVSPERMPHATIAYINSNLLGTLGYGPDLAKEPATRTVKGLLSRLADDPSTVDTYLETLKRDFLVQEHVIPMRGSNGQRVVVQGSSRILGLVGGSYYLQGIFHDVTLRHQLEASLRMKQETIDKDLDLAGWVQRSLIPNSLSTPEVDLEVRYVPAGHVGGDYVDFEHVGDDLVYLSVCDVSGHGVAAALVAARVNSEVKRWMKERLPPSQIAASLNWFFRLHFGTRGIFLSIFIARLDVRTGELTYVGAGHPPAFLIRASGNLSRATSSNLSPGASSSLSPGAPGGLIESLSPLYPLVGAVDRFERLPEEMGTKFGKGDKLILYTDGLFEVFDRRRKLLGLEGLMKILRRHRDKEASDLASSVLSEVEAFRVGHRQDDISLLILQGRAIPRRSQSAP
ncbi:MAG: SpoIIE family protein phosphatase [Planctomycetota bacterium]|nr:SpoIIE family protein phosphatase [Planctomycetota bacterium]